MRRAGTFAWMSARAARSTIRSWNEKRYSRRAPRAGFTKPALMRPRVQVVLVGVWVAFGLGLLVDELLGELELRRLHLGLRHLDLVRAPHVRRVVQLLHREHVAHRAEDHEIALAARRPAPDATASR